MDMSEKEALIRKYKQLQARENQERYFTTTTNNNVWKTAGLVFFGIIGLGCFAGIVYLIGQNSGKSKYNRCKC